MAQFKIFEDFGKLAPAAVDAGPELSSETPMTEQRVAAFEEGYKAGWDDAARAQSSDREKIGADLASNLQELSFTYAEVRIQMLKAMEPLLKEMVETVLPQIAAENLGAMILQELNVALDDQVDVPVQIIIAPSNRASLDAVLPDEPGFPLEIRDEPTLGEGQVFMRIGKIEKQIDLMEVLDRASTAVNGFFEVTERAMANE